MTIAPVSSARCIAFPLSAIAAARSLAYLPHRSCGLWHNRDHSGSGRIGRELLLLGRPGVGKTTMLRETARVLADDLHKRVMVVDTSNEIAGDGDIPHPAIGRARRMQVPTPPPNTA